MWGGRSAGSTEPARHLHLRAPPGRESGGRFFFALMVQKILAPRFGRRYCLDMENKQSIAAKILSLLLRVFVWFCDTEPRRIKRTDFIHWFKMTAGHNTSQINVIDRGYPRHMFQYKPARSYVLGLSIFRGKGYCWWLFGRRFSLRGRTFEFVWRGMRYDRFNIKRFCLCRIGVYSGGNSGWMPLWP